MKEGERGGGSRDGGDLRLVGGVEALRGCGLPRAAILLEDEEVLPARERFDSAGGRTEERVLELDWLLFVRGRGMPT